MLNRVRQSVMRFYYQAKVTKWLMYFRVNGPRQWRRVYFDGFKERPDSVAIYGNWIGCTMGNESYFCTVSISNLEAFISRPHNEEEKYNMMEHEKMRGKDEIDRYLLPECRCRLGFHWKCKIHKRWAN